MARNLRGHTVEVTFKTKNGNMWTEEHSTVILDILKRNSDVFKICYKDSGKIIYSKEENK